MQQRLFALWLQINYKYHSRTMFYDFFFIIYLDSNLYAFGVTFPNSDR